MFLLIRYGYYYLFSFIGGVSVMAAREYPQHGVFNLATSRCLVRQNYVNNLIKQFVNKQFVSIFCKYFKVKKFEYTNIKKKIRNTVGSLLQHRIKSLVVLYTSNSQTECACSEIQRNGVVNCGNGETVAVDVLLVGSPVLNLRTFLISMTLFSETHIFLSNQYVRLRQVMPKHII